MDFNSELEKHWPGLVKMARRMCHRSSVDHADLASATVVTALSKIRQFRPGTNMFAWLCMIMANKLKSICRRKKMELTHAGDVYEHQIAVSGGSPIESQEWRTTIIAKIDELPKMQREAVRLKLLFGMTYSDIAAEIGVSRATAHSRLRDGMANLRKKLKVEIDQ